MFLVRSAISRCRDKLWPCLAADSSTAKLWNAKRASFSSGVRAWALNRLDNRAPLLFEYDEVYSGQLRWRERLMDRLTDDESTTIGCLAAVCY
jgi:hypothetical protein